MVQRVSKALDQLEEKLYYCEGTQKRGAEVETRVRLPSQYRHHFDGRLIERKKRWIEEGYKV